MSTLPPSTANWHWKNKNITSWGKQWFERELSTVEIQGEGEEVVQISEVTDVDGDVELGQRKSKLITIYDCKIDLNWKGKASDGTEVNGKLKIPEVSHEVTLDGLSDYVYNWSLSTASSPAVDKLYVLAKSRLPKLLEEKFAKFPAAIIETHGKDLQVGITPEASRTGTPAPAASTSSSTSAPTSAALDSSGVKVVKQEKKPINTENVTVESTFMATADDLFQLLTNESRIVLWTRAPAQSKPEIGAPFSLFGGGVKGTYVSLESPKRIVQNWALSTPAWPTDHSAILTITLDQSTDSTKMTLSLDGVPTGMQDEIRRNIEGYYIQGFKSIGYVQLVFSERNPPSHTPSRRRKDPKSSDDQVKASASTRSLAIAVGVLVLATAFAIPYFRQ